MYESKRRYGSKSASTRRAIAQSEAVRFRRRISKKYPHYGGKGFSGKGFQRFKALSFITHPQPVYFLINIANERFGCASHTQNAPKPLRLNHGFQRGLEILAKGGNGLTAIALVVREAIAHGQRLSDGDTGPP